VSKQRVVIVGASLAGLRAAEALRDHGFDGPIALVGGEPELPYHRPPLSKEMLGADEVPLDELHLQPAPFFRERAIELHLGVRAASLDASSRSVVLATGRRLPFDTLVIATGATPRRLDVAGATLDGVLSLRSLADARELRERMLAARAVVVVGAGLLGLEIAAAARSAGREVEVLERAATPLRRVVDDRIAAHVMALHARNGVRIRTRTTVAAFEGDGWVERVRLADGRSIPAELVVVAAGVEPETAWLRDSGIALDDGVLVDACGATAVPGIYAAGDVARVASALAGAHVRFEQYGHAQAQGAAVGRTIAGMPQPFTGVPGAATSQFGVRIQAIGFTRPDDACVVRGADDRQLVFQLRGGRIVAASAFASARDFVSARQLVLARAAIRPELLADPTVSLAELATRCA